MGATLNCYDPLVPVDIQDCEIEELYELELCRKYLQTQLKGLNNGGLSRRT